jgi:competence protein ComEA
MQNTDLLAKIKAFVKEHLVYIVVGAVILLGAFFVLHKQEEKPAEPVQVQAHKQKAAPSKKEPAFITCDIAGAVHDQGVYSLKNGARIDDLIAAAGGLKDKAALKAINRATVLKDQDKVYIPYEGEAEAQQSAATVAGGQGASTSSAQDQVHINSASKEELQKLTGIGEKKAEQIIAYREEKGGFKKTEELMQVSGIGEKTFAAFKDQVAL